VVVRKFIFDINSAFLIKINLTAEPPFFAGFTDVAHGYCIRRDPMYKWILWWRVGSNYVALWMNSDQSPQHFN